MGALRKHKHRHTRDTSSISNGKLRLPNVVDIKAYRSALRGLQYDPYYRRRRFFAPPRDVDRNLRFLFGDDDVSTAPLTGVLSEGLADRRYFRFLSGVSSVLPDEFVESPSRLPSRVVLNSRPSRFIAAPPSPVVQPAGFSYAHLQFSVPRQVLTCIRRKRRREVILATGKGGRRHKRAKWSPDSFIRC